MCRRFRFINNEKLLYILIIVCYNVLIQFGEFEHWHKAKHTDIRKESSNGLFGLGFEYPDESHIRLFKGYVVANYI